ncbi:MAG: endopeptidase La [Candidatus Delongbacteria bacterium]|jgi:ATP-dependent Lon protease|nr:endopeptidase La [Candidatus Delongbacteria bacterium]
MLRNMNVNHELSNLKPGVMIKVVPCKDKIPIPGNIISLNIDSHHLTNVLEDAELTDSMIILIGKKNKMASDHTGESYFTVGSVGTVMQVIKIPGMGTKAVIRPIKRAKIIEFVMSNETLYARIDPIDIKPDLSKMALASLRIIRNLFKQYLELNPQIDDSAINLDGENEHSEYIDTILDILNISYNRKQKLLEITDFSILIDEIHMLLINEIEFSKLEKKIETDVTKRTIKEQKDYFLKEKLRGLSTELGTDSIEISEVSKIYELQKENKLSKLAEEKALHEIDKLKKIHSMSPEYGLIRDYLELIASLPWKKKSRVNIDIEKAEAILEEDHYGLKKPKERIIEYLSILKLVKKLKSPILCLVGPPGTGKTSLGKSIARSLGRKYIRMALGGVHDEAEIRGHRKTYIGAMPGKIVQSIRRAGVNNPLFLLDEIDKISSDFRGDPSSALLEVLDPEQNNSFRDNYLDVEFDLSNVLFIATANDQSRIPPALLDRMELIRLDGYLDIEKFNIAKKFLIPEQIKVNGLKKKNICLSENCVYRIISEYTMEAGVRELERKIAKICRKTARMIIQDPENQIHVTTKNLHNFLGTEEYRDFSQTTGEKVGEVNGLAWTISGGAVLKVESNLMSGKGNLNLTGKLGDVMKESAQAALSYIKTFSTDYNIDNKVFVDNDIHIHFPEGATPKDGPSAGSTIVISLLSAIKNIPVEQSIGMTGEITIHGEILAIGGLKTKLMAAKRSKISTVFIPNQNIKDLDDIDKQIKSALKIIPVSHISEVIKYILGELK